MIKIKKNELINIYRNFDTIKLNKISNASVRKSILRVVLDGKKVLDALQKDIESIREKFFNDFKQEDLDEFQESLDAIRKEYPLGRGTNFNERLNNLVETFPEIDDAYNKFITEINLLQEDEIDLNIDKIDITEFIDSLNEQDIDVTPKYLESLSIILKNDTED